MNKNETSYNEQMASLDKDVGSERFNIDKKSFGNFLLELRKQKGMTQKELANKLFVSDKAVSKWETGLSLPDITLLKPIASILEVTVAELLECRHIAQSEYISTEKVDSIIDKAIHFSEEEIKEQKEHRKKNGIIFLLCTAICGMEILILLVSGVTWIILQSVLLLIIMGFVFGIYFCFFAKEKLPYYYDENMISSYSDGFFNMNMPGIRFNNNNWKHILKVARIWSFAAMVGSPIVCLILNSIFDEMMAMIVSYLLVLGLALGGLFIPIYVVAKKYED